MAEKLIEVKNLQVTFGTGKKKFKACLLYTSDAADE